MKVLAVIIAHPLRRIAGATTAGRQLSLALSELIDIDLAVMWDRDETSRIGNLQVMHVNSTHPLKHFESRLPRSALVPLYNSRIPELIERGDYDLVHIHNLQPALAAERVATACNRRGIPFVISSHGFYEQSRYAELNGFTGLKKALAAWAIEQPFRRVVKQAAAIFALSDREYDLLRSLSVPDQQVHVVPNGVNEFYLEEPSCEEMEAVRAKFGLRPEPLLLFAGSLHRYKGLDVFLKALEGLRQPFQAVVAGSFRKDEERLTLMRGMSNEIAESVKFTGGVTDEELRALYHLADLFVYPTRGDTLPLVVLEAMACRLPIVSTTVGGIPFMVGEEEGVLVQPNDAAAVAEGVSRLLDDQGRRRAMGESARRRVETQFRWGPIAERAVKGYEAVLRREAPRPPAGRPTLRIGDPVIDSPAVRTTNGGNRPASIGIIGCGDIVRAVHLPVLKATEQTEVAWVTDLDEGRARTLAKAYGVRYEPLPRDLAELPEVDAYLLAIPFGVRDAYFEALKGRCSALYVEKPFARNRARHQEICAQFPPYALASGLMMRCWGPNVLMREVTASRLFGRLSKIRFGFGRPGIVTLGRYYLDRRQGGAGMIAELGIHGIDTALFVAGAHSAFLEDANVIRDSGVEVHTDAKLSLRTESGDQVGCDITVTGLSDTIDGIEFEYENAVVSYPLPGQGYALEGEGVDFVPVVNARNGITPYRLKPVTDNFYPITRAQMFSEYWRLFLQGMRDQQPNESAATCALLTTEVIESLLQADESIAEEAR